MTILFLCTGNSCRSQMAEGWANAKWPSEFRAMSAGTHPQGVNPITTTVMAEVGVDVSHHTSKSIDDIDIAEIDVLVTVCDSAKEACPVIPGIETVIHQSSINLGETYSGARSATSATVLTFAFDSNLDSSGL